MFKISEFSQLTKISPRMLRHYDKLNLLKPTIIEQHTGYRYYTPEQVNQANQILSLKNTGIPLKDVPALLETTVDRTDYFALHRKKIETELAEKKMQLAYLDLLEKKNKNELSYPIEMKTMEETFVLAYRQNVLSYYHEEDLWHNLFSKIREEDVPSLGQSIAVFHSTCSEIIDIEVIVALPKKMSAIYPDIQTFSPGVIASVVTSGAYASIPNVHEAMNEWLHLHQYVLAGAPFNIYHSSPATEEREELYLTEVCYPIKPL
ncbi:MerR family transcriptional regulator [Candidatus Enterococcus mansonii]|uniref:HTH merR-type domain-containing protein n=1 Tax=Candidatus Enterococcus mansonii TaxID=1834181 RepID=A0A242CFB3_9ENTE|nr:MerR family transcriptional regulator [Enterococcus sp. 4G2_DIV0659]OTO08610.1 hypothetical protein A5880_001610 [Enterococcus sp. 4G2_DIV0659]